MGDNQSKVLTRDSELCGIDEDNPEDWLNVLPIHYNATQEAGFLDSFEQNE